MKNSKRETAAEQLRQAFPQKRSAYHWKEMVDRTLIPQGRYRIQDAALAGHVAQLARNSEDLVGARHWLPGVITVVSLEKDQMIRAVYTVGPIERGSNDYDSGTVAAVAKLLGGPKVVIALSHVGPDLATSARTQDLLASIERAMQTLDVELHSIVTFNEHAYVSSRPWARRTA
jgi:hypothetical protein